MTISAWGRPLFSVEQWESGPLCCLGSMFEVRSYYIPLFIHIVLYRNLQKPTIISRMGARCFERLGDCWPWVYFVGPQKIAWNPKMNIIINWPWNLIYQGVSFFDFLFLGYIITCVLPVFPSRSCETMGCPYPQSCTWHRCPKSVRYLDFPWAYHHDL